MTTTHLLITDNPVFFKAQEINAILTYGLYSWKIVLDEEGDFKDKKRIKNKNHIKLINDSNAIVFVVARSNYRLIKD